MKAKTQNSCKVKAQLICAIVFAYAKSKFPHSSAHICLHNHQSSIGMNQCLMRYTFIDIGTQFGAILQCPHNYIFIGQVVLIRPTDDIVKIL